MPTDPDDPEGQGLPTLSEFEGSDGMLAGLGVAVSAMGIAALVLGSLSLTTEFSTGALRALLVAHPARVRLLLGKTLAVLAFVAAAVVVAGVAESITAVIVMAVRGGDTSAWWTLPALGESMWTLARAVAAMWAWTLIGVMLAALLRRGSAAIGIGVAYALVVESILALAWRDAAPYLPGSVMNAFAAGVDDSYPLWAGALMLVGYGAVFLAVATWVFRQRDVTV